MRFTLERVHYMPTTLQPGVLYVSDEYGAAAHLCACGCGSKVRTPIGPTEWGIKETPLGPSLSPSVGNWQLPCRSHYWISQGEVCWAEQWTREEIAAGYLCDEERRREYYERRAMRRVGNLQKLWNWIKKVFTK